LELFGPSGQARGQALPGQSGEKPLIVCGFCKPATFLD
jgi:hypothetical protein